MANSDSSNISPDHGELLALAREKHLVGWRGRAFRYSVVFLADGAVWAAEVSAGSVSDCIAILKRSLHDLKDPDSLCLLEAIISRRPSERAHRRGEIDVEAIVAIPSLAMDLGEDPADASAEEVRQARETYLDVRNPGERPPHL